MTSAATKPAVRASDAEREDVAEMLREQTATGRLTMDEFEERMAAAYHARTREELRELTVDLPAGETPRRMDERPSPPIDPCLLCLLLCICPPAGLVYLLMRRRHSRVHEPLDTYLQLDGIGPPGPSTKPIRTVPRHSQ